MATYSKVLRKCYGRTFVHAFTENYPVLLLLWSRIIRTTCTTLSALLIRHSTGVVVVIKLALHHNLCPLTFVGLIPPDWIQVPVTLTQTVPKLSCQFRHFVTSCFVAHGIRHSRTLIRIQASSDLSQTPLVHFGTFASSVLVYLELDTTTLVTSRSIIARQTQCLGSWFSVRT